MVSGTLTHKSSTLSPLRAKSRVAITANKNDCLMLSPKFLKKTFSSVNRDFTNSNKKENMPVSEIKSDI